MHQHMFQHCCTEVNFERLEPKLELDRAKKRDVWKCFYLWELRRD